MLKLGSTVIGVQDVARARELWAAALDFEPTSPGDKMIEVERLKTLGATEVDWDSYGVHDDFCVLADTEGNRFCVIDGQGTTES